MTILTYLLTGILVLDCLFLSLLVLVQLPKKEAGVGMAFGGGAADALFGAGSGTALSKLTKYAATIFFVLVFVISLLNTHARRSNPEVADLRRALQKETAGQPIIPPPSTTSASPSPAQPTSIPLTIASSNSAPMTAPSAPVAAPTASTNK